MDFKYFQHWTHNHLYSKDVLHPNKLCNNLTDISKTYDSSKAK
jgi:hypothetical protein